MSLGTRVAQCAGIETVHHTIKLVDVQDTISLSLSTHALANSISSGKTLAAVSKQSKISLGIEKPSFTSQLND